MQDFPVNFLALVAVAVMKSVLGALWYAPPLFGKAWMAAAGLDPERMKKGMPKALVVDLLANFVVAFVLVHAVHYAGAKGFGPGAAVGFFNWLGFLAALGLAGTFFEQKPMRLYLINSGFSLLSLCLMGGILAVWT